jgi:DNA/RNA endonuclease YhcR with UshA esterase domain
MVETLAELPFIWDQVVCLSHDQAARSGPAGIGGTILLAVIGILGLWAFSTAAAPLSPEDAARHMRKTATVCGVVVSAEYEANEQNQPTLLDLGTPHPNAIFTAVIYGDNRARFGSPETSLPGKRICVTGQISDYQGKPEIVLTAPAS